MKKKILSILLAGSMLFSAFAMTSCSDNSSIIDAKPQKGALTTKSLNNVYSAENISLLGTVFENMQLTGVYALTENKIFVEAYDKETYETQYFITDLDFKNTSELNLLSGDGENTEEYVQRLVIDEKNGGIWYIKNVYRYTDSDTDYDDEAVVMPRYTATADTATYNIIGGASEILIDENWTEPDRQNILVHIDSDGNVVNSADISSVFVLENEDGSTYDGWISTMVISGDKLVVIVEGNELRVFDTETLELTDSFSIGDSYYVSNLFPDADGNVYYTCWGEADLEAYRLDFASKSGVKVDFPVSGQNFYNYEFSAGKLGYDFVAVDDMGLYACNLGDSELTELCNYTNSDLDMSYSRGIPVFLENGKLLLAYYNYSSDENVLVKLEKVDPSQAKEKYIITVGGSYIPSDIKSAFIKFNRTSSDYKVVFKDYSSYDSEENNWNGSYEQLFKDIINNDGAPDIVILDYYNDFETLTSKGALADLNLYIDADDEFNRADYLENVFEALEDGGKLYTVAPSVNFQTVAIKKSLAGGKTNWTMSEFLEMHKSLGEGESMFSEATRNGIGQTLLTISIDRFIDKTTGKCTFNSSEFKSILEYIKDIPEDYTAYEDLWEQDNYWMDVEYAYSKGTTKLYNTYINNFKTMPTMDAYMGEEAVLIGYPTDDKDSSGALIMPNNLLAITSNTKVSAGAWTALKSLFSDEFQSSYAGREKANGSMNASYQFPVKLSMIEKKKVNDLKPRFWTYTDENGEEVKEYYDNTTWIGDSEVQLRDTTDADVQAVYDAISNATIAVRENEEVLNIINQEAEAYYNGEKSLDEIAEIINSRVQIYVSERI